MPKYNPETLAFRESRKAEYKKHAIDFLRKNGSGTSREIWRYIQSQVEHPQSQLLWACIKGSTSYKFTKNFMRFDRKTQEFYLLDEYISS